MSKIQRQIVAHPPPLIVFPMKEFAASALINGPPILAGVAGGGDARLADSVSGGFVEDGDLAEFLVVGWTFLRGRDILFC